MTVAEGTVVVSLGSALDALAAAPLHLALADASARDMDVRLRGEDIERVSTPSLQVLLAAAREVEAQGHDFALAAPSATLTQALEDLGLAAEVKRWRT
jgi:anti-anti-sigma regulatory factor